MCRFIVQTPILGHDFGSEGTSGELVDSYPDYLLNFIMSNEESLLI